MFTKVTLLQRVWAQVRNNPGITANKIMSSLSDAPASSITSALSKLDQAGVIYSTGLGTSNDRKEFFTEYEQYLSPVELMKKQQAVPDVKQKLVVDPIYPSTAQSKTDQIINTISLAEARELHKRLNEIFKQ
jgi:hypothetical protein